MEDASRTLVAGYRLDRYELLAPIADGGMASVWLARLRGKRGFEKLFAIKTIRTELTDDSQFQEMFLDEARIASEIHHPNVAQILDLGEQDEILYIVMEWVDGDSLAKIRRLAQKKGASLPLGLSLRILADACAGLHAAHELRDRQGTSLGVVHRDVSPHNIMVSCAGSVRVIDFGVAKARDRRAGETKTGVVKGKIRYMAPEQAQGHPIDRRVDVWALGVCLYELVTGHLPFDDESEVAVLRRLIGEEAPPRPGGAVPEAIEQILARSLVRDPEERFPTTSAMQRAIDAAIDELGLPKANEDIADFLRENLPELETKRREIVERALGASHERESQISAPVAKVADEEAFAPTVISDREGSARPSQEPRSSSTKVKKQPSSGKRKRARPKGSAAQAGESKVTLAHGTSTEAAPAPAKPGRGVWWAGALIAAGAGAWFGWPGGDRLLAMVASGAPPEPTSSALEARASPSVNLAASATVTAAATATASAATPSSAPADAGGSGLVPPVSATATTRPPPGDPARSPTARPKEPTPGEHPEHEGDPYN